HALSGETVLVTWEVRNDGNATTNLALWNDRVVLSLDAVLGGSDDIVLAGAVTHAGLLAPGESYVGRAEITLPRDLNGEYHVIVVTDVNQSVNEEGRRTNNTLASTGKISVQLAAVPDLTVSAVEGPAVLRPGDAATLRYTVSNVGGADANTAWRDRIYIDRGAAGLYQVATVLVSEPLAAGQSAERQVSFTLPANFAEGEYRWVVRTDTENTVYERDGEGNNELRSAAALQVARPDLRLLGVEGPALVQSGSTVTVSWTVVNNGAIATGGWVDAVYLARDGVLTKYGEVQRPGALGSG
ncbi:MAG TPA: hypothetical protein DCY18_03285, partial [Thauera sp.]|nr:hypothetical protein [Thauera sp.]